MSESTNGQNNPIGSFYPILWSCIYATAGRVQFCFSPGHQELNICDQKQEGGEKEHFGAAEAWRARNPKVAGSEPESTNES